MSEWIFSEKKTRAGFNANAVIFSCEKHYYYSFYFFLAFIFAFSKGKEQNKNGSITRKAHSAECTIYQNGKDNQNHSTQ